MNKLDNGYNRAIELINYNRITQDDFLDLGNLGLTEIPEELFSLNHLKILNLGTEYIDPSLNRRTTSANGIWFEQGNKFNCLPTGFLKLKKLTHLHLCDCGLENIESISRLTNLECLEIQYNKFHSIIDCLRIIKNFSKLKYLALRTYPTRILFNQGYSLENISEISIKDENIEFFNLIIEELKDFKPLSLDKIERLNLEIKTIIDIASITKLKNLEHLNISNNGILFLTKTIIDPLSKLNKLRSLDLSQNKLNDINRLVYLKQLQSLNLNSNEIQSISELSQLSILESLSVSSNNIEFLDDITMGFPMLNYLNVNDNSIKNIPLELLNERNGRSRQSRRNLNRSSNSFYTLSIYFEELKKGFVFNNDIKIIIVGNGRVGKTCLVNRLLDLTFNESEKSTHAIQCKQLQLQISTTKINEYPTSINCNIWDFGGQYIYHSTHRVFMKTKALFIVVWDWESEHSKWQIETENNKNDFFFRNEPIPYWLDFIQSLSTNSKIIITQNKIDLKPHRKEVPNIETIRENFNIIDTLQLSAKNKTGFHDFIEIITSSIIDIPEIKQKVPESWNRVKMNIERLSKDNFKQITRDDFKRLLKDNNVEANNEDVLLQYLHNIGVVFYKNDYFKDNIIIDQQWAITALYTLFNRETIYYELLNEKNGFFTTKDLDRVWKENTENEKILFVDLMLSCELCAKISGSNYSNMKFLAPELMKDKIPPSVHAFWEEKRQVFGFRFKYIFLHSAFISRFIIKTFEHARYTDIWKSGIWLNKEKEHALIVAYQEKKSLKILSTNIDLLWEIIELFEDIHSYDVEPEKFISINGIDFLPLNFVKEQYQFRLEKFVYANKKYSTSDFSAFMHKKKTTSNDYLKPIVKGHRDSQRIKEKQIEFYISQSDIDKIILELLDSNLDEEKHNNLLLIQLKYSNLVKELESSIITTEQYDSSKNEILSSLRIIFSNHNFENVNQEINIKNERIPQFFVDELKNSIADQYKTILRFNQLRSIHKDPAKRKEYEQEIELCESNISYSEKKFLNKIESAIKLTNNQPIKDWINDIHISIKRRLDESEEREKLILAQLEKTNGDNIALFNSLLDRMESVRVDEYNQLINDISLIEKDFTFAIAEILFDEIIPQIENMDAEIRKLILELKESDDWQTKIKFALPMFDLLGINVGFEKEIKLKKISKSIGAKISQFLQNRGHDIL